MAGKIEIGRRVVILDKAEGAEMFDDVPWLDGGNDIIGYGVPAAGGL